jgi:hypothetical protein
MIYAVLDARFQLDDLGYLPSFLDEDDPDDARTQLDKNYQHGGGYRPQPQWKILDMGSMTIQYPGDPALHPLAVTTLRQELIFFFPHAYVLILQPNGDFVCARMD